MVFTLRYFCVICILYMQSSNLAESEGTKLGFAVRVEPVWFTDSFHGNVLWTAKIPSS